MRNHLIIIFILFLGFQSENNIAQSDTSSNFSIGIGVSPNIIIETYSHYYDINGDYNNHPIYAEYFTFSFHRKIHEFFAGALLNELTYKEKYKPSLGGTIGYRIHLIQEHKIDFFLQHAIQFQHYTDYYRYAYYSILEKYLNQYYNYVFGYGVSFPLTKNHIFEFCHTAGFALTFQKSEIYHSYTYNQTYLYYQTSKQLYYQINLMFGLSINL